MKGLIKQANAMKDLKKKLKWNWVKSSDSELLLSVNNKAESELSYSLGNRICQICPFAFFQHENLSLLIYSGLARINSQNAVPKRPDFIVHDIYYRKVKGRFNKRRSERERALNKKSIGSII